MRNQISTAAAAYALAPRDRCLLVLALRLLAFADGVCLLGLVAVVDASPSPFRYKYDDIRPARPQQNDSVLTSDPSRDVRSAHDSELVDNILAHI